MKLPKYVVELMKRSQFTLDAHDIGYRIRIRKFSPYQRIESFQQEIDHLRKWVENIDGGEIIIHRVPKSTHYNYNSQLAEVTIYDPIMMHLEKYIHQPTDSSFLSSRC